MRMLWWKILGIALLLYTIVVGMGVPLKPGIVSLLPDRVEAGQSVTFVVTGYNTHFDSRDTKAWLELDDVGYVQAKDVRPTAFDIVELDFDIPSSYPQDKAFQTLDMVIHSGKDGISVLPSAVSVKTSTQLLSSSTWDKNALTGLGELSGMRFPYRPILNETIRNTFFHIPLWFSMFILLIISLFFSVKYLVRGNLTNDIIASSLVNVAILFGILGIITGSLWARFTWGTFWTTDVKLNMATVAMLIYLASLILRGSINDIDRRAKLSASYNIFAFFALIPLVFIIPRLTDSLHPGNGGNPALGEDDMENTLRMVFYPAIIGFTLLGLWIGSLLIRFELLKDKWLSRS